MQIFASAYYNRGNAYYYKRNYDKAVEDYTEAIRLNPNYVDVYENRGSAYTAAKAINDYTEAIRIKPN